MTQKSENVVDRIVYNRKTQMRIDCEANQNQPCLTNRDAHGAEPNNIKFDFKDYNQRIVKRSEKSR